MKTEAEIRASIKTVEKNMDSLFDKAREQFDSGDLSNCLESLFTLSVNISAIEAGYRVLEVDF